jgi:predicted TIM-barrel fold metal-dependent hydrolase
MDFETYLPANASLEQQATALADILKNEDAAGIELAVVMPYPTPRPDNHGLFETTRGQHRVLPCCQVNPNLGEEATRELETAVTKWGARAVKLMPSIYGSLFTPQTQAIVAKARELGIYVNIHSGGGHSHPLAIGAVCRRFPEVTFVMDHMGYREWLGDAIVAAQDNPNLYLGATIASFEPGCIERAVKAVGPERIVFGSNLPLLAADLAAEAIRRWQFGREVEELILGGNLARIYGLA